MLNIVICDDEQNEMLNLKKMTEDLYPNVSVRCFDNSSECIEYIKSYSGTDIFLIDVCISENKDDNGIRLAEIIRQYDKNSVIIFISAFSEYVFKAFDVYALNYLLKPVDIVKFGQVFLKAVHIVEKRKNKNCMVVKHNGCVTKVNIDDIYYIENFRRKIILHCKNGQMEYYGKFNQIEGSLSVGFFKCHRSYIVNMDKIVKYTKTDLILENGDNIPVSKYKYSDFINEYSRFLRGDIPDRFN